MKMQELNAEEFLGNLMKKGDICVLDEAQKLKYPLILGKFMSKKSLKMFPDDDPILIIHVKELYQRSMRIKRKEFVVVLVGRFATAFDALHIEKHDYVVFVRPIVRKLQTSRRGVGLHDVQLMVNSIKMEIYHRKRHHNSWTCLDVGNGKENTMTRSIKNVRPSSKDPRNVPCCSKDLYVQNDRIIQNSSSTVSLSFTKQNTTLDRVRNKETTTPKSLNEENNSYHYVKLTQLSACVGLKVHIYAVILKIIKKKISTKTNRLYTIITVTDETCSGYFTIQIYSDPEKDLELAPSSVIRLHRMKIEVFNGNVVGVMLNTSGIIVVHPSKPNVISHTSKTYTFTDSDAKRIKELIAWFKNKSEGTDEFKRLENLSAKREHVNLIVQVLDVKQYPDKGVIILNVNDETLCPVPVFRYNTELDDFVDVRRSSNEKKIDMNVHVLVTDAEQNFMDIQIGDKIKLFNVTATPETDIVNMKRLPPFIRLWVIGRWENMKFLTARCERSRDNTLEKQPINEGNDGECSNKRTCDDASNVEDKKRKVNNISIAESVDHKTPVSRFFDGSAAASDGTSINNENINESPVENTMSETCITRDSIYINRNNPDVETPADRITWKEDITRERIQINKNNADVDENEHVDRCLTWPENILLGKKFEIKSQLISTDPVIDSQGSYYDLFGMIVGHCIVCNVFIKHSKLELAVFENKRPRLLCPTCEKNGRLTEVSMLIKCELELEDENKTTNKVVLRGDYAEKFFDCNVEDLFFSDELKKKARQRVLNCLPEAGEMRKSLQLVLQKIREPDRSLRYIVIKTVFL